MDTEVQKEGVTQNETEPELEAGSLCSVNFQESAAPLWHTHYGNSTVSFIGMCKKINAFSGFSMRNSLLGLP
jgi:hypothetical protein